MLPTAAPPDDPTLPAGARPDEFFTADQIRRLTELVAKWRLARDQNGPWSSEEDHELHTLIDEEIAATIPRARKLRAEGKL